MQNSISNGNRRAIVWPNAQCREPLSADFTQSRLLCTKLSPDSRFIPAKKDSAGLHGKWVGLRYAIPSSHKPLLPAFTHFWQKQANTRNFIDMPFDGILPPPLHHQKLTRILHHYIYREYYNIMLYKSQYNFN